MKKKISCNIYKCTIYTTATYTLYYILFANPKCQH